MKIAVIGSGSWGTAVSVLLARHGYTVCLWSYFREESERLAGIMKNRFVTNLQPDNERETKLCKDELYLCYYCNNPAVMVECGFLSNPDEAAKLTNKDYQQQVAFTVFSGINEFIATE